MKKQLLIIPSILFLAILLTFFYLLSIDRNPSEIPSNLLNKDVPFFETESLIKDKNFVSSLIQNVASIYTLYKKNIKNSVILNYDNDLSDLGFWYQQLTAESLGKDNK